MMFIAALLALIPAAAAYALASGALIEAVESGGVFNLLTWTIMALTVGLFAVARLLRHDPAPASGAAVGATLLALGAARAGQILEVAEHDCLWGPAAQGWLYWAGGLALLIGLLSSLQGIRTGARLCAVTFGAASVGTLGWLVGLAARLSPGVEASLEGLSMWLFLALRG